MTANTSGRDRGERHAELRRLAQPLAGSARWAFGRLHLWLGLLGVAWCSSGVTVVQPDEVALVLRLGSLRGAGTPAAVRQPGVLLALPSPIDEVIRVPVRKVTEVELRDLHYDPVAGRAARSAPNRPTLDPTTSGYALTGDQNIVHLVVVARVQVSDPVAWALGVQDPPALLRDAVLAALLRSVGELPVDNVLAEGREDLLDRVQERAQARLDEVGAGLTLVALELTELVPPGQVRDDFTEVQNAFIGSGTKTRQAEEYRAEQLPKAQGDADVLLRDARVYAEDLLAAARGEVLAFDSLAREHRQNPAAVRQRLYREGIDAVLAGAGRVRILPPPAAGRYGELRITVPTSRTTANDDGAEE